MIAAGPSAAPRRTDLPWLRHRTLRGRPGTTTAQPAVRPKIDFSRPGRTSSRPAAPAPPPVVSSSLDLSAPSPPPPASSSLDLSAPSPPPATSSLDLSAPAPPPPASSSLDLSAPTPPAPTPASTSLDLGGSPPAPVPPSRSNAASPRAHRPPVRVEAGGREILTHRNPTVTLNRVQSGIGTLTIDAVCSPAVGDLRLGALFQLADGSSSLVRAVTGLTSAPPGSRRPVLRGSRSEYERLIVDLRQARTLQRMLVYAFSESGAELAWDGILRITTFGGARLDLPMDVGRHHGPLAVLSLYNVDGEFVLRAELDKVTGEAREVARSYGYDLITWADATTPLS